MKQEIKLMAFHGQDDGHASVSAENLLNRIKLGEDSTLEFKVVDFRGNSVFAPNGDSMSNELVDVPQSLFVHRSGSGYFTRIGSSKREMPPEVLARLFQQRSQVRLISFRLEICSPGTMSKHHDAGKSTARTILPERAD